jgi:hypothetical protein
LTDAFTLARTFARVESDLEKGGSNEPSLTGRTGHDCDRNRWCPDHGEQSLQDQLPCLVRTDVRLSTASR